MGRHVDGTVTHGYVTCLQLPTRGPHPHIAPACVHLHCTCTHITSTSLTPGFKFCQKMVQPMLYCMLKTCNLGQMPTNITTFFINDIKMSVEYSYS
jgi:hypothetical protein